MASALMPHFPLLKFHTRRAKVTQRSAVSPRTAARMEESSPSAAATTTQDTVVQYVVLRRDLIDTWPLGSVVTQGCHASVAAIWTHKDDPDTLSYCSPPNLDSMHKVTLEVKGETQLLNLSEKLKAGGVAHKLWIEQPENFATCLATKPCLKSSVSSFFKKLKLCK
ncbi:putative peptidyl-tRNA hydrolase PTRHD1 [Salvia divinorum]|uniref:peptidyl-tRNA hydrolase n=1 Tax=Salvia divinorum TaxID=28513 RepID=A0ABD1H845_SALDI